MKHLLNNLSSEEKNSIREQYEGGMSVDTSKFRSLLESKLGDVKPLISEQGDIPPSLSEPKTPPPTNTGGMGTKSNPYKLKYFYYVEGEKSDNRGGNINVFDLRLFENRVEFMFRDAGASYDGGRGRFFCDTKLVDLPEGQVVFSDEGNKIFQSMCDEYVSTGSKQQNVTLTEQEDVTDVERKQFTDMMRQEYLDKEWKEEMDSCLNGVHGKSKGKDFCLERVYRENMESIDNELTKMGFPNGFHVPENISRQDFNELKIKFSQSMI